jgi:hypothetical protein
MIPFLQHWVPIWIVCAVGGFTVSWVAGELMRGPNPRWFETTRFTFAEIFHREKQYWHGHDIAKYGYDRLERIEQLGRLK